MARYYSDAKTTAKPSRRNAMERTEAFDRYVEHSAPYFQKIEDDGDQPWHEGDLAARRELFDRRYIRPAPPAMIPPIRSLREINRQARNTTERTA